MTVFKKIKLFFEEVRVELQKVTWSTREELVGSTSVVLATMFILSTFIGFADFICSFFLRWVLR
jgi:preprotein translocase subunit SecE